MHPASPFLVLHPTHILVHPRVHRAHRLKSAVLDYYLSLTAISAFLMTETTAHPYNNQTRRAPRPSWPGAQSTYFPKPQLGCWKEWVPHTKTKAINKWKLKRAISIYKQALKLSQTKTFQNNQKRVCTSHQSKNLPLCSLSNRID